MSDQMSSYHDYANLKSSLSHEIHGVDFEFEAQLRLPTHTLASNNGHADGLGWMLTNPALFNMPGQISSYYDNVETVNDLNQSYK
ncbi:hypothetical protein PAXINDRAFT_20188 [Paxillus involutus ATCC 200175]|uniref:Uncharacterized protein n=1 Tax=Paxillus involutus ATCC 200175 TaxID=664439 RepID=A0A0C9TH76_PAXIN|nr:hypothetical protein PAXINDRAFT_20188 [Paxillus involutus ATCC 200175]